MMLSRLHVVPGIEHDVQIIGVNLFSLVLSFRGPMVLQSSHILNDKQKYSEALHLFRYVMGVT